MISPNQQIRSSKKLRLTARPACPTALDGYNCPGANIPYATCGAKHGKLPPPPAPIQCDHDIVFVQVTFHRVFNMVRSKPNMVTMVSPCSHRCVTIWGVGLGLRNTKSGPVTDDDCGAGYVVACPATLLASWCAARSEVPCSSQFLVSSLRYTGSER